MHDNAHILSYLQPAANWNEALPIGNGRLGAMVYGSVENECYSLNEDTLWSGYPMQYTRENAVEAFQKAREMVMQGNYLEAQRLLEQEHTGFWSQVYLCAGDLQLSFHYATPAENYSRTLDMRTAVHTLRYTVGGVTYTRESFISHPAQCLVIRLTCDKKGALDFSFRLAPAVDAMMQMENQALAFKGNAPVCNYHPTVFQGNPDEMNGGQTDAETKAKGKALPNGKKLTV